MHAQLLMFLTFMASLLVTEAAGNCRKLYKMVCTAKTEPIAKPSMTSEKC